MKIMSEIGARKSMSDKDQKIVSEVKSFAKVVSKKGHSKPKEAKKAKSQVKKGKESTKPNKGKKIAQVLPITVLPPFASPISMIKAKPVVAKPRGKQQEAIHKAYKKIQSTKRLKGVEIHT